MLEGQSYFRYPVKNEKLNKSLQLVQSVLLQICFILTVLSNAIFSVDSKIKSDQLLKIASIGNT